MASGGPPDTLRERHRLIAYLDIAGKRNGEIAKILGYTESRVSIIRNSPLYVALCNELRVELKDQTIGGIVDRLQGEAGRTLDVLIELRDHAEGEPTRLGAANSLADRITKLQRVNKVEEERTVKIVLDGAAMAAMAQAHREVNAITSAPPAVRTVPAIAHEVPDEVRARSLEESIAKFTEMQEAHD
jgi:hypothetical protein